MDTFIFYLWSAVGALLALAGIFVARKQLRLPGAAICVGGLCLRGAASLFFHPQPTLYRLGLPSDARELQDQIVELTLDRDRQRNERTKLLRKLNATEVELQHASERT